MKRSQVWSWMWAAEVDGDEIKEMRDATGWLRTLPGKWQESRCRELSGDSNELGKRVV